MDIDSGVYDESNYEIKLKYGLRNDTLVEINEITKEQKGLKCNCTCPGCGRKLQARLGNGKKQPHFAHNGEACDLVVAQQSALHILAKDIIKEEKKICLPTLKVSMTDIPKEVIKSYYYNVPEELVFMPAQIVSCEKVELEKKVSNIVPDIIVTIGGKECLIEIAVTHFIDEEKNEKIKRIGLPVVEIDLSDLPRDDFSKDCIKDILLKDNENKRWIYNPKREEAYKWALNQYKKKIDEIIQAELENERKEKEKREQIKKKRQHTQELINTLQINENYEHAIKELRNDKGFNNQLKRRKFYSNNMSLPFYMDIPITGEVVFDCDRRIWQSAVFDRFIYNRNPNEEHFLNIKKIQKWIKSYQNDFNLNWELVPNAKFSFSNINKEQSLYYCCLKQYFRYLSYLGFISGESIDYNCKVLVINSLEPPNKKSALRLETILKEVNQYSWNVSRDIYKLIEPRQIYIEQSSISDIEFKKVDMSDFIEQTRQYMQPVISKKEIDYKAGMEEVIVNGSLVNGEIAKDSFGYRWLVCTECGEIKREDEMAMYQGTTGICRDCKMKELNGQ